eukprot:818732-Alexandrium_andersonii.AAC.1
MGTPCETYSRARVGPPGPRPLRSARHIYGLPKSELSPRTGSARRLLRSPVCESRHNRSPALGGVRIGESGP